MGQACRSVVVGIIDQVENAVACWNEIAKDCGVRENHREEISRELVEK